MTIPTSVDYDNAGATKTTDVIITVVDNVATAAVNDDDMDTSVVIGVTKTTAILLTTTPTNVAISWAMLDNNDNWIFHIWFLL